MQNLSFIMSQTFIEQSKETMYNVIRTPDRFIYRSALNKIITTGYKALQLMYFFTAGHDEVRAWTIQVRDLIRLEYICFGLLSLIYKYKFINQKPGL